LNPPKSKKPKTKSDSAISSEESPSKKKSAKARKVTATKPKPTKKKAPVKADRGKGLNVLSEVALSEAAQLKEATKRSKKEFHASHASGLGDGTDLGSGVPDEQHRKTSGIDEGTGTKPGVPDVPTYDSESDKESWGNSMAPKSIAAISHDEREELRKKGIKSPSKFLSLKYLSPASIQELNKNPSAPKRVHFVNSIVILSTDSDTEEEDDSSTNACDLNLSGMVRGKEEVKEQGKEDNEMKTDTEVEEEIEEEESKFETDEEVEEIIEERKDEGDGENFNSFPTMEELTHHEKLLKNPRPPWELTMEISEGNFHQKQNVIFTDCVDAVMINTRLTALNVT
ncbi:hypothetical protein Tco_0691234, partial [Tanacetum coccineum]